MPAITLASSSPYRRDLLARLGLNFNCISPNIDESANPGESPEALVLRLAEQKAHAVTRQDQSGLIIASDQVASFAGEILTKPGDYERAHAQLSACSGQAVVFYTSLALFNTETNHLQCSVETTRVHFRPLSSEQISRYLQQEQPYDCAGSFKVEGLGISLFSAIESEDPNSLIGLPLIRLVEFLGNEGIAVP